MSKLLQYKIKHKQVKIAVVGLGYVGLPLAMAFAEGGFSVIGLETDVLRIKRLQGKRSYISDVPSGQLVKVIRRKRFQASGDFSLLKNCAVVLICVPTPLKRKYTPDISFLLKAVRMISQHLGPKSLVVVESTTYPGTTEEEIKPILENNGRQEGRDFYLAFSPERIDPGNKKFPIAKIPKVVGGVSPSATRLAKTLYGKIIKDVHPVASARAAEMTKLLENSFRIINIGWINEAAKMCHKMGIDVWEVIEAARSKPFGFMPFYPGLGVGGHCIPDDPLYLYWKARHHGHSSRFLKLSSDINSGMPAYVITRLADMLKKKTLSGSRILVVGVTYKKDVKDLRKSPPLKLIELLKAKKSRVCYYDPLIPFLRISTLKMKSVSLSKPMISRQDCVVIATDHSKVNYAMIAKHAKKIFDVRNVYGSSNLEKIVRL